MTSLNELSKQAFVVIRKDKEVLLFTGILVIVNAVVTVLIFLSLFFNIFSRFRTNLPSSNDILLTVLLSFVALLILRYLAFFFYAFIRSAIIITVAERKNGGDPRIISTIRKVMSVKKKIIRAGILVIRPRMSSLINWGGKRFIFEELLLDSVTPEQAITRAADYYDTAWAKEMLVHLKWGGAGFVLRLAGYLFPFVAMTVTQRLNLININDPVRTLEYIAGFVLLAAGYLLIYNSVFNAWNMIYDTLVYLHFVQGKEVTQTSSVVVVKHGDKEKIIPLS